MIGAILHRMPSYVGLDRGRLAFIGGCTAGVHNVVMHDLCATRRDSIAVGVKALQFDGVLPTPGSAQSCWTFVLQNSPSQLKQASLAKAPAEYKECAQRSVCVPGMLLHRPVRPPGGNVQHNDHQAVQRAAEHYVLHNIPSQLAKGNSAEHNICACNSGMFCVRPGMLLRRPADALDTPRLDWSRHLHNVPDSIAQNVLEI